jgi:hypothetical protein
MVCLKGGVPLFSQHKFDRWFGGEEPAGFAVLLWQARCLMIFAGIRYSHFIPLDSLHPQVQQAKEELPESSTPDQDITIICKPSWSRQARYEMTNNRAQLRRQPLYNECPNGGCWV